MSQQNPKITKEELTDQTDALRDELTDIYADLGSVLDRLDRLEAVMESIPENTDKLGAVEDSRNNATLSVGESYTNVVTSFGSHGDPMTHTDGVATFLNLNDDETVTRGDTVEYTISHVADRHAKGVVTEINPDQ